MASGADGLQYRMEIREKDMRIAALEQQLKEMKEQANEERTDLRKQIKDERDNAHSCVPPPCRVENAPNN